MSKMKFTPSQEDAINARGGAILVSAAAGSGKTRVLVQRVISRLTDEENPIDADRFLIVTFTSAAAAEMKKRISDAIDEKLIQDPNNAALRRQQLLLPRANISTVHSFCSHVIRENFYTLNINQDFRIGNESEISAIQKSVISDIIEEMYAQKRSDFILLSNILSGAKSDSGLEAAILKLHEKSTAHPFPEQWIAQAVEFYNPEIPLSDTIFAKKAIENIKLMVEYFSSLLNDAHAVISENEVLQRDNKTAAINVFSYYISFVAQLVEAVNSNQWSEISHCVSSFSKPKCIIPKSEDITESEKQTVKNCFTSISDTIQTQLQPIFDFTDEIYTADTTQLYPVLKCLQEILAEFDKRCSQAKNEKGILEYSDLEHYMIKLLVKQTDSGYEKTDFARSFSTQFDEIMIDEYQDTNEIQELIFRAVSNDGNNIFVVGDVKQSIYRFREAMPEIFIRRRENSVLYDRENPQFPAKIILDKNFRSREGIIDSVNFVFERLMSKSVGDIEYNDEEKLVLGASYPDKENTELELHIIPTGKKSNESDEQTDSDDDDLSKDEKEAMHIVGIINDMMKNGTTVTEKSGSEQTTERPLEYDDICILLRNISSHARVYSKILNENGIPAYTDSENSLFECYEVNVALSFLKIVDNPLQDIPLLSVMMSSIVGFTSDDLAVIRSKFKTKSLYTSVYLLSKAFLDSSKNENTDSEIQKLTDDEIIIGKKCAEFLDELAYFRRLSVTVTVSKLLDVFFERTSYVETVSAMKNGKIRVQNIHKFMGFIRDYESGGKSGLTGFVRLVNHIEESGNNISAKDAAPLNSVKIMSIHKSKGLEFPICIMAATASKGGSDKDAILCHSQLGFGLKSVDTDNMLKFSTLQRTVIQAQLEHEKKSEELRVLYVAMTRAKEKLIVISSVTEKTPQNIAAALTVEDGKILPYNVEKADTIAELIIMCALLHPSMNELRSDAGAEDIIPVPTKSKWKYVKVENISNTSNDEPEEYSEQFDGEFMEFLKTRFQQKYTHKSRTLIPSKVSASALAHNDSKFDFVAKSRPAFMQEKKMTGSERGTAMHLFMQYADFSKIKDNAEIEKQRIAEQGFMSPEQCNALNNEDINKFTQSELFSRMLNSEKLYREYRFTVNISAKDIDENTDCNDSVILQGAIDCIFIEKGELVIVDYKTDRVKDVSELALRYAKQLRLYKNAAEQLFELPVKECMIYSLHLGEQTTI